MWPFKKKKARSENPLMDALYRRGECPDCGGTSFTMGPRGGECQNVKCSNTECSSEFNLAPFADGKWGEFPFIADRVDRSEEESKALYGRGYGPLHPKAQAATGA